MKRLIWPFLVAGCLLLARLDALPALDAATPAGLQVTAQPAPEYTFDGPITFRLSAAANSGVIVDATLYVRTPDLAQTFVGKARFTRGPRIDAVYTLEPDHRRVAPFAPVTYWWEVADAAGQILTTDRQTFTYTDNRFKWQTLDEAGVTVAWYAGDRALARAVLDAALDGGRRAAQEIQAPVPTGVTVYVYASAAEAQPALRTAGRLWVDGAAAPLFGAVVVSLPPDAADTPTRLAREVPHEMAHLAAAAKAGAGFENLPTWLSEGLARLNEASPDSDARAVLTAARAAGSLPTLSALCGPFPPEAGQAQLAYTASETVVRFLRERYGAQSLTRLVEAYADGVDCDGGVQRVLGLSLADLDRQWTAAKLDANPAALPAGQLLPWISLAVFIACLPLVFLAFIRGRGPAARML